MPLGNVLDSSRVQKKANHARTCNGCTILLIVMLMCYKINVVLFRYILILHIHVYSRLSEVLIIICRSNKLDCSEYSISIRQDKHALFN